MAYVTLIAMLALVEYLYFMVAVGGARGRTGIKAPATSGDPEFERFFRVHQNTLEQLIVFIPALYATAFYANELYAIIVGVLFLIGRAMYFLGYSKDAEKRGPGALVTMLANVALVAGGIVGAVLQIV